MVVVAEAAEMQHQLVQRLFPGMAEAGVPKVVRQRHRLRQILVEAERAADGAGDLRHFQAVGQAGAVVVALVVDEDLGLVFQLAESAGMDDAVAVALKDGTGRALRFGLEPATGMLRHGGERSHPCRPRPEDVSEKGLFRVHGPDTTDRAALFSMKIATY